MGSVSGDAPVIDIPAEDPRAGQLLDAVRSGNLGAIRQLLAGDPRLANARLVAGNGGTRTPLHLVADWPGYFPAGPQIAELLMQAGADPDARTTGRGTETPLHWTASSDDVEVAAALIAGGADIDAPGGSIGTPLANAVGYGCWHVARLLAGQGARISSLWEAAALGNTAAAEEFLAADPPPDSDDIDEAFWQACHGGQRRMAEYLLARGARLDAAPGYSDQTALQVTVAADTRREALADWLRERGAP
jgi:ankyrin repeat protein